ncbi:LysM peptidoglycan-binding domain-containing protein [Vandammella animalimorsus]|uniref:LysM peptidoglycan-binding domain-containing protein n=2 Tax=Vandammella animalimorsus TaxID=2029117 RepID=A0A3M6R2X9_9BURK|nr:LysM peptidoglycan-binding domain-containing protein [Vandammella animalimorsus]
MRAGFAMPDLQSPLVHDREQWYASRPDTMLRMSERSRKYLFHIVEELERRGMPTELALLPFVESAYNPGAVSSAKAAGMWQFMPATGTYFELRQNAFRDDRRDVLASTRAALDYLEKLHGMFGDWHLALAAYNWGEGSVQRARAKNQNQGLGVGYLDLRMPEETRWYVPKFQALKNIVRDPERFNVVLADIGNHPYFESVEIRRDIDVARAAQLAGISEADFRLLNPAHKGPVIFAAATSEILLPWDNAEFFKNNLAQLRDARLASWTVWTAPQRMPVAEVAKKVGADEQAILSVNRIPKGMLIEAGAALLVPRSASLLVDVAAEIAQSGQLKLAHAPRPQPALRRSSAVVRKGDTLDAVARRHGVSVSDLYKWNQLGRNARLKAGQKLVLYQAAPQGARNARAAASAKSNGNGNARKATNGKAAVGKTANGKANAANAKSPGKAPSKKATSKTAGASKNASANQAAAGKSSASKPGAKAQASQARSSKASSAAKPGSTGKTAQAKSKSTRR